MIKVSDKKGKIGIALCFATLVALMGIAMATQLVSDGLAFKDFDVNEDSQVTFSDVQEVFDHIGDQVNPPWVSKYDMDLDADVDMGDVNIIYSYMDESQYTIDFGFTDPITDYEPYDTNGDDVPPESGVPHYILYVDQSQLDKFVQWFNNYTPINYHTWSAAGRSGYPAPTPYHYVCIDFASDAYWVNNKNFLDADNVKPSGVILPAIAVGFNIVTGHAYNYILTRPDWWNEDAWVVFEPQVGKVFTWDEIRSDPELQELYGTNFTCAELEYYRNGEERTFEFSYSITGKINAHLHDTHVTTFYAINEPKAGCELDHYEGAYGSSSGALTTTKKPTTVKPPWWPDPDDFDTPPLK
ncbi:hypothetical protein DRP04_03360 [Archaeoglobales archaeon]|nr:MAG: hypothetical protein DRP04_03360 [Archaeoglobales archaeon]